MHLAAKVKGDSTAPPAERSGRVVLQREGEYWTVQHGRRALRLRDSKGLGYLATLFANPDVELAAADLVAGTGPAPDVPGEQDLRVAADTGDAGALLDDEAKAAYRARLEDLREEIEEADSWGDPERAAAAREELDFVSHELASAVGLGGRDRKAASSSERARVNATRAIKSALKRIAENDEELGRQLDATVKTGTFCSYKPVPGLEVVIGEPAAEPSEPAEPAQPAAIQPSGRALRTLVFTDIVGSTDHVARLGDAGWRDLLQRHDEIVREHVRTNGGTVVGKAGDGFFLAFDAPGAALECARGACAAVTDLGLELRAGVHAGECEVHEDTLVGMAVHVASRVSDIAGAGEVLTSRTVRDLVAGSDIPLLDRGAHDLRGIPGSWRLFALGGGAATEVPAAEPEAEPAATPVAEAPARTLFGRDRELRELERALLEAKRGHGSLFLIAGEPGVGKTRLADALSGRAREAGAQVHWGHCWEGGGAPVFWPWVQVIRSYARSAATGEALQRLGSAGPNLVQLVPELRDQVGGSESAAAGASEQARFAMFDAVSGFLAEAGRQAPLVVVLDDLHAADEPSLLLLDFLAPELRDAPVLVIGTYRPLEGPRAERELLRRLVPSGRFMPLAGLGSQAVEDFVEERTGMAAPGELADALHVVTEGNPFFMEEVVRLLLAEGALDRPEALRPDELPVPEGVREAINRRLEPLDEEVLAVLRPAALLGKEFTFAALERVAGLPPDRLLEILDEAASHGVVTELVTALGRYRFVHALVREVLYEGLNAVERVRLHAAVGEGLEALYADDPAPHLAELAHHFLHAAAGGDADKGVHYATEAGHRAMALLAFEEAARHYESGLLALELRKPADPAERCDLLLALGAALRNAGRRERAKEEFRLAADLARRVGAPGRQAQAALGFAGRHWVTGVSDPEVVGVLEDALAALGEEDQSQLRAALLARLSTELYYSPTPTQADELSKEAVTIARKSGDRAALAPMLEARLAATWRPDNLDERAALADEVVELADQAGDAETALRGRTFRITCLLEQGEVARADRELALAARLAEERRRPRYVWHTTGLRAMRAVMSGRFDEAEQLAQEALEIGHEASEPNAPHYFGIQFATLRYCQGRLDEIEEPMRAFVDRYPNLPPWRCTLALLYAELGQTTKARREFEIAGSGDWDDFRRDGTWLLGICRAADACARLGALERGPKVYGLLLPYRDRNVMLGRVASVGIGSAARYLGLLAGAMSRWDEAVEHFETARRENDRMGLPPWRAFTDLDYAAMLLSRGEPGDDDRAGELLADAAATAERLGMAHLAERIESVRS